MLCTMYQLMLLKLEKYLTEAGKLYKKLLILIEEGIELGKSLKLYHNTKHFDCQDIPDDEGFYLLRYFPIRSVRAQNCCSLLRCSRKLVNSPLVNPRNSVRVKPASTTGFAEALLVGAATLA